MVVVSGGQTGVDRAAWDAAMEAGLKQSGWVPRGRRAEDGRIPGRYACRETVSRDYGQRTERNLREADATLVITFGPASGGTKFTIDACRRLGRPHLVVDLDRTPEETALAEARTFLSSAAPRTLNVAGPRASFRRDVYERALAFLRRLLAEQAAQKVNG